MKIISFTLLITLFSFSQQQDCPPTKPNFKNGVCEECPYAWNPYRNPPSCIDKCPGSAPRPDPQTGWCTTCPETEPRWIEDASGFSGCTSCDTAQVYDKYLKECADNCPSGTSNSGGLCVAQGGVPRKCPAEGLPYYDPVVQACIHLCPVHTSPGVDDDCTSCPDDKPRWNSSDLSVACLSDCPRNKPDYITETNVCNFCDTSLSFWDNSTLLCVSECIFPTPSNTTDLWCTTCANATNNTNIYWDPVNETCVEICPPSLPTWDDDKKCLECPDETQFWLNDTQSCLLKCPDSAPSWNEYKWCQPCTVDKPYWNATNQTCEVCPAEKSYWDNITQTCVEECYLSAPDTPDFNVNKWCQACDISQPYWNNAIHQCVDPCPNTAPYINDSNWCLACTDPKPVWIDSLKKCNETCPIDMPDTNDIGWCVSCDPTTPFYNSTSEECEVCPDSDPYYDSDTRICVNTCPFLKPDTDVNKWCISCGVNIFWDNFTDPHTCTSDCPHAAPLKNTAIYWCQACSGSTAYYNQTNGQCVSECASPLPVIGADNWCEACPTETPYWDPSLSTPGCVADCSASVPLVDSRNVCIACQNNVPYWNMIDKVCVATCPISMPYVNQTNKTCQACQENTKWSDLSSTCVETCPVSIPKLNSSNWCTACTAPTSKWDPNYNGGDCVSGCPVSTPDSDAFNWCHACPSEKPRWDSSVSPGRCTSSCPVSLPKTGQNSWCEACPSSQHWSPITSSCTQTCIIPKPYVNADNWCDVCPSAKPFWDAALPGCVSNCPRRTPSVDTNNQCQSCPSDKPNWNPDASTCVVTCPPTRPFVATDNWCEPCPNPTPYWFSGNNTCVEICPPVAPAVDNINWCRECSGATLKWNPLVSACVSECPESLPFWNANAIPRACEAGPDLGDIIKYLETSGVISSVVLAGMQMSMPGIPYVASSILLVNMLKYIRYLDINYPPKPLKMFQRSSLNIPSLNFGPLFPEDWKSATYRHPAPERFAQYDISGLFIVNFWRILTTALILIFGVVILKIFLKNNTTSKVAAQVRDRAKIFLIWNYAFSFFASNIGNIVLFIFIEYWSLALNDVIGTLSFVLTLVFAQISLLTVIHMIKCVKKTRKAYKQNEHKAFTIDESFIMLMERFKHENLAQMLYIPILCIRASITATIVGALHAPVVQCSLLVAVNVIMLAYFFKTRPHRETLDNVQIVAFEITILVADIVCLYLSTLPWEEQIKAESAGWAIIVCNVTIFTLSIIFVLTRVIVIVARIFKEKFRRIRPSVAASMQTDVTRTELDISTAHALVGKKKTVKGEGYLTLSFESSAELNIGTEEDQSPTLNHAKTLNNNNLKAFHIVTIPDNEEGDEEQQQTSKYFDTEV